MKVKVFTGGTKDVAQIEKANQVHQLVCSTNSPYNFVTKCTIRVWNNHGPIIPPMKLSDLAVLNGDEYPLQCGFDFTNGNTLIVLTYEICDEGSISKPVYVELDLTAFSDDVELDSIDVNGTTAVRMRGYNVMNVVSPMNLPKNSICIFEYGKILQLQKNNDVMGMAEILTHSNCILREGTLAELHPVVFNTNSSTPLENVLYSSIASDYIMGYSASLSSKAKIIIMTGNDDFTLYPVSSGCSVTYCQKSYTKIAENVRQQLIASGQINNVDKGEFAAAVAAVGNAAQRTNTNAEQTGYIAQKVVELLPSTRIAKLTGIRDFNLASESVKRTGLSKTL